LQYDYNIKCAHTCFDQTHSNFLLYVLLFCFLLFYHAERFRSPRRSSNHGDDNIITNGSGIAVADGQCMLIVEQGRVVEVCAEPGEYTFDSSTEPSVFTGNFGDSLAATFQTVAKRFTYGGDTGKDQRVYYINTKDWARFCTAPRRPSRSAWWSARSGAISSR